MCKTKKEIVWGGRSKESRGLSWTYLFSLLDEHARLLVFQVLISVYLYVKIVYISLFWMEHVETSL